MSLNTSFLMGRLTKDVELRTTQNGKAFARFTVAVDSKFQKDKTNFIPCTAWGKSAEFIAKYFSKGSLIALEGEIVTGQYQDKDGKTVYTVEVNVDRASFTGERRDSGQPVPQFNQNQQYTQQQQQNTPFQYEDDELPF